MTIPPLYKIPRELRDEIYRISLDLPEYTRPQERIIINIQRGYRPLQTRFCPLGLYSGDEELPSLGLLRTSRAISEESAALLYSRVIFGFSKEPPERAWKTLQWFLETIGEKNRSYVKEISIDAPFVSPYIVCPDSRKMRCEGIWWLKLTTDGSIDWSEAITWTVDLVTETIARQLNKLVPGLRTFELVMTSELEEVLREENGSEAANQAQHDALEMISRAFRGTGVRVVFNLEYLLDLKPRIKQLVTDLGWSAIRAVPSYTPSEDPGTILDWIDEA